MNVTRFGKSVPFARVAIKNPRFEDKRWTKAWPSVHLEINFQTQSAIDRQMTRGAFMPEPSRCTNGAWTFPIRALELAVTSVTIKDTEEQKQ
jgi:hypothetical protein